jgi:hypothetical protein
MGLRGTFYVEPTVNTSAFEIYIAETMFTIG